MQADAREDGLPTFASLGGVDPSPLHVAHLLVVPAVVPVLAPLYALVNESVVAAGRNSGKVLVLGLVLKHLLDPRLWTSKNVPSPTKLTNRQKQGERHSAKSVWVEMR